MSKTTKKNKAQFKTKNKTGGMGPARDRAYPPASRECNRGREGKVNFDRPPKVVLKRARRAAYAPHVLRSQCGHRWIA